MCVSEQLNEIINILKDNTFSNWIAIISVILSLITLVVTIFVNHRNHKQYIDSLKPLLSFEFCEMNQLLILAIKNTGNSEATEVKVKVLKLRDNGKQNKLVLDNLFKKSFMLYPTEEVQGIIGFYGETIDDEVFPKIDVSISYIAGNNGKEVSYDRTISFKRNIYARNPLSKIEDGIESISYSNNRLANYIEGRTFFTFDRINALPKSSLYEDMKDAINNVERPSTESDEENSEE